MSELNFDLYSGSKAVIESFNNPEKQGNLILDPDNNNMYVVNEQGTADVVNESYFADAVNEMTYSEGLEYYTTEDMQDCYVIGPGSCMSYHVIVPSYHEGKPVTNVNFWHPESSANPSTAEGRRILDRMYKLTVPKTVTSISGIDYSTNLCSITCYNPACAIDFEIPSTVFTCPLQEIIYPTATEKQLIDIKDDLNSVELADDYVKKNTVVHNGPSMMKFSDGLCLKESENDVELFNYYIDKSEFSSDDVTKITQETFSVQHNIENMGGYKIPRITKGVFPNCRYIGKYAFSDAHLSTLTFGSPVTLEERAFSGCRDFNSFPSIISVNSVGSFAFDNGTGNSISCALTISSPATISSDAFHITNKEFRCTSLDIVGTPTFLDNAFHGVRVVNGGVYANMNDWDYTNWVGSRSPMSAGSACMLLDTSMGGELHSIVFKDPSEEEKISGNIPGYVPCVVIATESDLNMNNAMDIDVLFMDCAQGAVNDGALGSKINKIVYGGEQGFFGDSTSTAKFSDYYENFQGSIIFRQTDGAIDLLQNLPSCKATGLAFECSITTQRQSIASTVNTILIRKTNDAVQFDDCTPLHSNGELYFNGKATELDKILSGGTSSNFKAKGWTLYVDEVDDHPDLYTFITPSGKSLLEGKVLDHTYEKVI